MAALIHADEQDRLERVALDAKIDKLEVIVQDQNEEIRKLEAEVQRYKDVEGDVKKLKEQKHSVSRHRQP